jgi:hypothetical protein
MVDNYERLAVAAFGCDLIHHISYIVNLFLSAVSALPVCVSSSSHPNDVFLFLAGGEDFDYLLF